MCDFNRCKEYIYIFLLLQSTCTVYRVKRRTTHSAFYRVRIGLVLRREGKTRQDKTRQEYKTRVQDKTRQDKTTEGKMCPVVSRAQPWHSGQTIRYDAYPDPGASSES